jgi:hypothetical protein
MIRVVKTAYDHIIAQRRREIVFWILATFLPTFLVARTVVYLGIPVFIHVRGVHIHHLAFGIIVLAVAGYFALTVQTPKRRDWIAALYGIGLALAFDEFGMWVLLRDDYWIRWSYDAILIIGVFLVNTVYFADFWLHLLWHLLRRKQD